MSALLEVGLCKLPYALGYASVGSRSILSQGSLQSDGLQKPRGGGLNKAGKYIRNG